MGEMEEMEEMGEFPVIWNPKKRWDTVMGYTCWADKEPKLAEPTHTVETSRPQKGRKRGDQELTAWQPKITSADLLQHHVLPLSNIALHLYPLRGEISLYSGPLRYLR